MLAYALTGEDIQAFTAVQACRVTFSCKTSIATACSCAHGRRCVRCGVLSAVPISAPPALLAPVALDNSPRHLLHGSACHAVEVSVAVPHHILSTRSRAVPRNSVKPMAIRARGRPTAAAPAPRRTLQSGWAGSGTVARTLARTRQTSRLVLGSSFRCCSRDFYQ